MNHSSGAAHFSIVEFKMDQEESYEKIKNMCAKSRYEHAQKKTDWLVDYLGTHIKTHYNNAEIFYSSQIDDCIAGQSPELRVKAQSAYERLKQDNQHYEIIRMCSFWDGVDYDSYSIPTIVAFAKNKEIDEMVYYRHFHDNDHKQPFYSPDYPVEKAKAAKKQIQDAIEAANKVSSSKILKNMRNLRHKLSHQIDSTHAERKKNKDIPNPTYGCNIQLLDKTIAILDDLHKSLNNSSFDWQNSKDISQKNAKVLKSVSFPGA